MTEWIKSDTKPFLLVAAPSVSHDPYIVPKWFSAPAKDHLRRYQQTINYTDAFIKAFDAELTRLNLKDNTILCVISDHGEGFGEHGQFAHEGIGFEETVHVPWVVRAPNFSKAGLKISDRVSSVDVTPTLLGLLGFALKPGDFDGVNALGLLPPDRKVFFVGGMYYGPTGYVSGNIKYFYDEVTDTLSVYNLADDPAEKNQLTLPPSQAKPIIDELKQWRIAQTFAVDKNRRGKTVLYNDWIVTWGNTICRTKYKPLPVYSAKSNPSSLPCGS